MYGHGTSHCHRAERCLKCGGSHSAVNCLITDIKCANCQEEHVAISKACKNRIKYVAIRENISINRQLMQMGRKPNSVNSVLNKKEESIPYNASTFPVLNRRNTTEHQHFYRNFSSSQPVSGNLRNQSSQDSLQEVNQRHLGLKLMNGMFRMQKAICFHLKN